jgi:hypothetical protein
MLPNARVCCLLLAPAFLTLSGSAAQTASKTPFSTPNRLSKQSGSDSCYRKLSSNDRLTVFAVTIAPHQSTLLASHPNDYLLISLEKSALEAAGVSGNSYVVQLDAEEMQVMKGGWSHRLTNVGETAANLLQVRCGPKFCQNMRSVGSPQGRATTDNSAKRKKVLTPPVLFLRHRR